MIYVGIDIAKETHVAAAVDSGLKNKLCKRKIP